LCITDESAIECERKLWGRSCSIEDSSFSLSKQIGESLVICALDLNVVIVSPSIIILSSEIKLGSVWHKIFISARVRKYRIDPRG